MALATGVCRQKHWEALAARGELISSFNGKPEALPRDFAYAYGSPLNENSAQSMRSYTVEFSEQAVSTGCVNCFAFLTPLGVL